MVAKGGFPHVLFEEQGSAPATPPADHWRFYRDATGWHAKDDTGAVSDIGGTVADILDLATAETDATLVLAPDGAGGVEFRAETGGGGAEVTASILGYDTVGGTEESATINRVYAKSFTPTATGYLSMFEIYTRETTDSVQGLIVGLYENNAGALGKLISMERVLSVAMTNNATFGGGTASVARWLGVPLSGKVTSGTTYWVAWMWTAELGGSPTPRQFYDGSGTDRRYDSTNQFLTDGGRFTETTDSRKYSVRVTELVATATPVAASDLGALSLLTRRAAVNTEDDLFDASSLDAKWLAYTGYSLTADLTTLQGWLRASTSGYRLQAVPAGDWTIETEVMLGDLGAAAYQNSGLILTNGTTIGSSTDARFGIGERNNLQDYRIVFEKFVNGAFSSAYTEWGGLNFVDKLFIRFIKSGTTYYCEISTNGKTWHRWTSTGSLGFTPTHFGLGGDQYSMFNSFHRY